MPIKRYYQQHYIKSQARVGARVDGYPNRCEADWLSLEARILAHQERVAREEPEGEREFREGMAETVEAIEQMQRSMVG